MGEALLRRVKLDFAAESYKVRGRWPHSADAPFAPTPCVAQPHLGQGYAPTPLVTCATATVPRLPSGGLSQSIDPRSAG